ncbi:MAG: aminotransferase class III-fold pyridoxal phosphate-dependent enzyme [Bacteroidota bacterium]
MKLFDVYPLFDIEPHHAKGCRVWDKEGKEYLDFYGGHAVISIGHGHPHFLDRLQKQLQQLVFYSNSVQNPLQLELAQKLGTLSGCTDYQLFLCNSGAEANENALKLASFYNGRKKIIAFHKGFHGRTAAAVNTTDNAKIQAPITHGFEVDHFALNEEEGVAESLAQGDVCAVIIEGIQGIGGIHEAKPEFLQFLQKATKAQDTLLILDEVQSGYGRSGTFFAFQSANIQPDLITVAKGMGNGFPIGGVLIGPHLEASYGLLGTTFGGNHLACAAGLAVLEVLEQEQLLTHAKAMGAYLKAALEQLPGVREVRGRGLMMGIEMDFPIKAFRRELIQKAQLFTGASSAPNVIRLLPPLTIQKADADLLIQKFSKGLKTYLLTTTQMATTL